MINKLLRIYILLALFGAAGAFAFADEPSSALDDKPSVDNAAVSASQPPAAPSDATATAADAHTSYLYDLKKLIEKSRANIKEVNEKIKEQAVLKRNQKREERAREYYEKGVELTNEGKLDEARDYFEKAIRITEHPEMAGYIKESQRRLRKQEDALHTQERERYNQIKSDENVRKEDVETAYKEAVDLYKQKKYHPAKDAFEHVDEIAPDYRATDSYLKIIDQDIITSDAQAAKQQAVEIARQQNEAEAARQKEKQMWMAQIEEKEKERKESIDKQAEEVYDEAVELYKNKKFAAAKKKFEEVSWVIPDYKATMKYLGRIDRDAQKEQERDAQEQQKALQEQRWEEEVEKKKQEAQQKREFEAKERQRLEDLQEQAQFLYTAAVSLFDKKNFDEASDKFNDIEKLYPNFKSTRTYIARINQWKSDHEPKLVPAPVVVAPTPAAAAVPPPAPVPVVAVVPPSPTPVEAMPQPVQSMPAPIKVAVSLEDQQKQVQDIADLADRSARLYRQVSDIADDRTTEQTKRKMARVDAILNNLKENQERLLRQMREEEWRHQQEESKAKQEEHRAEAEKMYQAGLDYLRSHEYAKAKIQFLALENLIPDYRATHRYLSHIEEDQRRANVEAVTAYERNQADHLKQLQDKENAEEMQRAQQDQEKQHEIDEQQQASLNELAQKASDLNDDIIRLSQSHDYEGMKVKFTELENTVTALTTLKDEMSKEKDHQDREKQLAHEAILHRNEAIRSAQQEDRQIHAYSTQEPAKEDRPILSNQPSDVDLYKHREIMQEQNTLFSEAVDRYENKKYTQAKLLFGELADQHDRRAEVWLKKVDRAITHELLKSQEGEERERTAFIEDQLKAQRELNVIQERERQRQKKLTEELERQTRLYEDDRLLQLRKEETMRVQERERERQEAKRLQLEKESEKKQEAFRFHKIETVVKQPQQPTQAQSKPVAVTPPPVAVTAVVTPPAMTAKQLQAQADFSNKRKDFLDRKFKKEQEAAAREAKKKADAQARAERTKERADKLAQEKKHREEFILAQKQEREEKIKQAQIMREESKHMEELQRQEHDRQAQLEARRESVRKLLEDGVETMYQEAVALYKQGNYSAAADKFKDVQDILPGYKRSAQYMDESRQKALSVSASPDVIPPSPPVTHQDSVDKALDLFDPNAK